MANDRACRLLGHSSHDLIGQKLTQFFLKPDPDVVQALSEEHVEADGHAAVAFGTVVSAGLWAAGAHSRPSRRRPWRRGRLGRGWVNTEHLLVAGQCLSTLYVLSYLTQPLKTRFQ